MKLVVCSKCHGFREVEDNVRIAICQGCQEQMYEVKREKGEEGDDKI